MERQVAQMAQDPRSQDRGIASIPHSVELTPVPSEFCLTVIPHSVVLPPESTVAS
jgi:hypothetical protein